MTVESQSVLGQLALKTGERPTDDRGDGDHQSGGAHDDDGDGNAIGNASLLESLKRRYAQHRQKERYQERCEQGGSGFKTCRYDEQASDDHKGSRSLALLTRGHGAILRRKTRFGPFVVNLRACYSWGLPASEMMMTAAIDKTQLLVELRALMEADLEIITASQEDAQAGATHAENKAEGDKDMRSTEDSYLARGLAKRVTELRAAVVQLSALRLRTFDDESKIALTALVEVEDDHGQAMRYFVAPVGGGIVLGLGETKVSVVTPSSPLGQALLGRELDDEVELRTPMGRKSLSIVGIA